MKCKFEKDVHGFYILPLFGYSWGTKLGKSLWFGFAWWLWTWQIKEAKNE